jgi:hypothetical protein
MVLAKERPQLVSVFCYKALLYWSLEMKYVKEILKGFSGKY